MNEKDKHWHDIAAAFVSMRGSSSVVKSFGGIWPPGKFYGLGDNNEIEEVHAISNFVFPGNLSQRTQEQLASRVGFKTRASRIEWGQVIAGGLCGCAAGVLSAAIWLKFFA